VRSGKAPSAHRKSSSAPRGRSADDRAGIEAVLREVPCCESGAIPGLADQVDRLVPRQLPDDAGNTRRRNRLCPGHVTCVVLVGLPHVHNPAPALGRHHQLPHIDVLNHNPHLPGSDKLYPPGYSLDTGGNVQAPATRGTTTRSRRPAVHAGGSAPIPRLDPDHRQSQERPRAPTAAGPGASGHPSAASPSLYPNPTTVWTTSWPSGPSLCRRFFTCESTARS
jgi:hypothetical protein